MTISVYDGQILHTVRKFNYKGIFIGKQKGTSFFSLDEIWVYIINMGKRIGNVLYILSMTCWIIAVGYYDVEWRENSLRAWIVQR